MPLLGASILGAGEFRLSVEEFRTALSLDDQRSAGHLPVWRWSTSMRIELLSALVRSCVGQLVLILANQITFSILDRRAARNEKYKEAADAYERFLFIAPKTDVDRRARIVGLIDFLRYLGKQGSLYVPVRRSCVLQYRSNPSTIVRS